MKSTHQAIVIPLVMEKHPNADALSIVKTDLYQLVVRTEDWVGETKAVHILPETVVDTEREEFKFLAKEGKDRHQVVQPVKLRGEISYGCLVRCPEWANVGDDLASYLEVKHYDPEEKVSGGRTVSPPVQVSKYDIDTFMKYYKCFNEGEEVWVEEKIHGANCRIFCKNGEFFVGSRNEWKAYDKNSAFWKAFKSQVGLEDFVYSYDSQYILYGECYGNVKGFSYGLTDYQVGFAAFDIYDIGTGKFIDIDNRNLLFNHFDITPAKKVYQGALDKDKMMLLCKEPSLYTDNDGHPCQIREGIVIRPMKERWDSKLGRVITKLVNPYFKG